MASRIETVSRVSVSDSSSSESIIAIAKGASGWFIVKSSWRSSTREKRRPRWSTSSSTSMISASRRPRKISTASRTSFSFWVRVWWLVMIRWRPAATASPGRAISASTIEAVIRRCGRSASGGFSTSLVRFSSDQLTAPSGMRGFGSFFRFFALLGALPASSRARCLARSRSNSMVHVGACTTTWPTVSYPARPARPAIWWNSRAFSRRIRLPSNFASPVSSTVRIGTLMPTPRVSVPQMIFSSPDWASFSTRRRYFGSMPAWCTPMPSRTRRERICPKPLEKRKSPISSRIRSFSSALRIFPPCSACACSRASFWVKWTMYTGASRSSRIVVIVSGSGVSDQRKSSGTGRGASATTVTARSVRSSRSSTKKETSPRVALISTNWQRGSSTSGTCQAQPRCGSP